MCASARVFLCPGVNHLSPSGMIFSSSNQLRDNMSTITEITERFRNALDYAARKHATQTRKASDIPYLSHLMSVCSIVMDNTPDEDVWIAALLHDAVEDQGGEKTALEIEEQFGKRVADLVRGCSEMTAGEDGVRPSWLQRKQCYLANLPGSDPGVLLISVADKLHNARSVLRDWLACGEDAYCKFSAGKAGTHWYYQQIIQCYRESGAVPKHLLLELEETVSRFAPDQVDIADLP